MITAIYNAWHNEMQCRTNLQNGIAVRISQLYSSGACIYLYYGIGPTADRDQYETFEELTAILRKTICDAGGSVSHHHGVGKKNIKWYPRAVSEVGIEIYKSIKARLDPNNVFDASNLVELNSKL